MTQISKCVELLGIRGRPRKASQRRGHYRRHLLPIKAQRLSRPERCGQASEQAAEIGVVYGVKGLVRQVLQPFATAAIRC
jgi:hypothetical protein